MIPSCCPLYVPWLIGAGDQNRAQARRTIVQIILDAFEAALLGIAQELREVALWFESEADNMEQLPLGEWHAALDKHIDAWTACLSKRELLPRAESTDREQVRRVIEHAASLLSPEDTELKLREKIDLRLEQLEAHLRELPKDDASPEELQTVENLSSDIATWRRSLEAAQ